MAFTHLEEGMPSGRMQEYLDVSAKLHEPTKTVFAYALDMAAHFNNLGLNKDYALFGGYAVLSHLMKEQGESIAAVWRGSNDIDMNGNRRVLNALHSGYDIHSALQSPHLEDKITIKLATDGSEECRIDLYTGDFDERFRSRETNVHFGIPVSVVDPISIVESKLKTPKEELQHTGDIMGMLYVLEKRGYSPKEVAEHFTHSGKAKDLHERLVIGKEKFKSDRLGLFPTEAFSKELGKILHKFRPVTKKR